MSKPEMMYFAVYSNPEFKGDPILLAQIDKANAPPEAEGMTDEEIMQSEIRDNPEILGHAREQTGQEDPVIYVKRISGKEFMKDVHELSADDESGRPVLHRVCPICLIDQAQTDPPFDATMPTLCDEHNKELNKAGECCILFISDKAGEHVPDIHKKMINEEFGIPPAMIRRYVRADLHMANLLLAHNRQGMEIDPKARGNLLVVPDSSYGLLEVAMAEIPKLIGDKEGFPIPEFCNAMIFCNAAINALRNGMSAMTKLEQLNPDTPEPLRPRHPAKDSELN